MGVCRLPLSHPVGSWVGHNFQDSILQAITPLKRSAGRPDPTSLGIFASRLASMARHAHGLTAHGVFGPLDHACPSGPDAQIHPPSGITHSAVNLSMSREAIDGAASALGQVLTVLWRVLNAQHTARHTRDARRWSDTALNERRS